MVKKNIFVAIAIFLFILTSQSFAVPKPLVYFTFDKLDDVIIDSSGNGNDGMRKGNIKLNDNGKVGKCFEFNGNSYIDIARVVQDDFTLMAWIKTDQVGVEVGNHGYEGSGLFWSDIGGVANDFILAVLGKKLSFFCGNPDTSVNSDKEIVTGDWVHVAGVRSVTDQKISIYINGKFENSIEYLNEGSLNAQPRIHIGGNTLDRRYYRGLMDEVKIFDSALTEEDMQQILAFSTVDSIDKISATWGMLKANR
ncbi:TPA: LamG domain-containing protein [bacterium]|nr:LamG domain-containing protein [bacterium]